MSTYSYPTVALCLFKTTHKGCVTHPATSSTVSLASSLTTSSLSTLQASCGTSGVASSCRRVMMKPTSHSCTVSCCRQPEEWIPTTAATIYRYIDACRKWFRNGMSSLSWQPSHINMCWKTSISIREL